MIVVLASLRHPAKKFENVLGAVPQKTVDAVYFDLAAKVDVFKRCVSKHGISQTETLMQYIMTGFKCIIGNLFYKTEFVT